MDLTRPQGVAWQESCWGNKARIYFTPGTLTM